MADKRVVFRNRVSSSALFLVDVDSQDAAEPCLQVLTVAVRIVAATVLKGSLIAAIRELKTIPREELADRRYEKFRKMGVFEEALA